MLSWSSYQHHVIAVVVTIPIARQLEILVVAGHMYVYVYVPWYTYYEHWTSTHADQDNVVHFIIETFGRVGGAGLQVLDLLAGVLVGDGATERGHAAAERRLVRTVQSC